ncbi:MAG: shikimate kinase [Bacteroidales bacterium]|nr:shikimate kinase [Bacteroidales bacterium]MBN2818141.1 shikimate kinase [Bacteroidales bacterium]
MRLFIIGYKNCGKTTIGKKVANRLNLEFIDLDEVIEKKENKTIPELYSEIGDEKFRILEWKALKDVIKKDNIVVSTGGGAPCHCDNMNLMEEHGDVIYIHLDSDTLVSRLKRATKDRPIVLNKTDEELREYVLNQRNNCEHHYARAKYTVEGKDLTVDRILNALSI